MKIWIGENGNNRLQSNETSVAKCPVKVKSFKLTPRPNNCVAGALCDTGHSEGAGGRVLAVYVSRLIY